MPRCLRSVGLIFSAILLFTAIVLAAEEITITTYYPSPYGAYNELQLYPHDPAVTTCDDTHKGTMFYKSTDDQVYVCKGATLGWQVVGGGITTQNVVTGSRAFGTSYRNTTGKTMFVVVAASQPSNGGSIYPKTDSLTSPITVVGKFCMDAGASPANSISFFVLPNNYYKVDTGSACVGATTPPTLTYWTEWY